MTTTERFSSLQEVRLERLRLRATRDARAGDLRVHWENLANKEFRRGLVLDVVTDLFHRQNGAEGPGLLVEGVKLASGWLPLIGPLLAGRRGALGSRWLWSGLSMALPFIMRKGGLSSAGELWTEVRKGIQQVKEFVRGDHGAHAGEE